MIETNRFLLRPLTTEDATFRYLSWIIGENGSYISYANKDRTLNDLKSYIEQKSNNRAVLFLGIFSKDNGEHVGNIKYEPIDFHSQSAIMGILIGEKQWRGKGVAPEVIKSTAEYLFREYKVKQFFLGVDKSNLGAIRAYQKVGFLKDNNPSFKELKNKDGIVMSWKIKG